jgi:hypothetical protein
MPTTIRKRHAYVPPRRDIYGHLSLSFRVPVQKVITDDGLETSKEDIVSPTYEYAIQGRKRVLQKGQKRKSGNGSGNGSVVSVSTLGVIKFLSTDLQSNAMSRVI